MSSPHTSSLPSQNRMLAAVGCFLVGTGMEAFGVQTVLSDFGYASQLMSRRLWETVVSALGSPATLGGDRVDLDPIGIFLCVLPLALAFWLMGGWWIAFRGKQPYRRALTDWGIYGWLWWLVPGVWELSNMAAGASGWESVSARLAITLPLWIALARAGWLATLLTLSARPAEEALELKPSNNTPRIPGVLWLGVGLFVVVFGAMNWQLYQGLHVPHGDSAMYEEHLWNVWHGKGFRSYLDRGLFLGEHIQVVHLLLLPLHLVWPSHLLLELSETLALALGAIPIFRMAVRHSGSRNAGLMLAAAYLFYFPLHYLDISIDLKTFRPISFGVPLMLFALDQMELKRYRSMLVLLLLALSAKEDFAVPIALLGMWMVLFRSEESEEAATKQRRLLGTGLALFGIVYLLVVIKVAIPWFRDGDVHYAQYFGALGNTPGDIVKAMFSDPGLVLGKLFSFRSLAYFLLLMLPVGFLPLFSPGRLLTAVPLFGVLCLMELSTENKQWLLPWHHFHAPLIPVLFWSAAAGLQNGDRLFKRISHRTLARFAFGGALATGVVYGFSPLSAMFWDSGSPKHWETLYVPGDRAKLFPKVLELIPEYARVASTDFVHPRFTHFERSYDYSKYPRKVNDNQPGAPPDTDFIVIETQSRYSEIKRPEQVPEYVNHPEDWELLQHDADTYFIVLKRRHHDTPQP